MVFLGYIWPGHVVRIMVIDFGDRRYRHALFAGVCNIVLNITGLLVISMVLRLSPIHSLLLPCIKKSGQNDQKVVTWSKRQQSFFMSVQSQVPRRTVS